MRRIALALAMSGVATIAHAQTSRVRPELAGISFLIGDWSAGKGVVADTGGTSTGSSQVTVAANGAVLLRRDRTNLFDKTGKPSGGFDQIMMIYSEGGALRADYSDGNHVIHYTQVEVTPGKTVTFVSAKQPGVPVFKLVYTLTEPSTLAVSFAMSAPGMVAFNPIATGTLRKDN